MWEERKERNLLRREPRLLQNGNKQAKKHRDLYAFKGEYRFLYAREYAFFFSKSVGNWFWNHKNFQHIISLFYSSIPGLIKFTSWNVVECNCHRVD